MNWCWHRYEAWGRALLDYHSKPRTDYRASLATSHLGYSTSHRAAPGRRQQTHNNTKSIFGVCAMVGAGEAPSYHTTF